LSTLPFRPQVSTLIPNGNPIAGFACNVICEQIEKSRIKKAVLFVTVADTIVDQRTLTVYQCQAGINIPFTYSSDTIFSLGIRDKVIGLYYQLHCEDEDILTTDTEYYFVGTRHNLNVSRTLDPGSSVWRISFSSPDTDIALPSNSVWLDLPFRSEQHIHLPFPTFSISKGRRTEFVIPVPSGPTTAPVIVFGKVPSAQYVIGIV